MNHIEERSAVLLGCPPQEKVGLKTGLIQCKGRFSLACLVLMACQLSLFITHTQQILLPNSILKRDSIKKKPHHNPTKPALKKNY